MVTGLMAHEFDPSSFNMNKFFNQLQTRLELLLHADFTNNMDTASEGIILTIQEHIQKLNDDEKVPIEIFDKLANAFADRNSMMQEVNEKLGEAGVL